METFTIICGDKRVTITRQQFMNLYGAAAMEETRKDCQGFKDMELYGTLKQLHVFLIQCGI